LAGQSPRNAPESVGPDPLRRLRLIDAKLVRVLSAFDLLIQEFLLGMTANLLEPRYMVNDIHSETESVDVVVDGQLERSTDTALLLVATDMNIVVICAAIGQMMYQLRIAVKVEDDRLVNRE